MKVLHLLSGGGIGGIEILCRDIANLSKDQHEFCFLYSGGMIAQEMLQKGVPVHLFYEYRLPGRMYRLFMLMLRNKYDVVIVHHEGIGIYSFFLMLLYCFPRACFIKYLHCSFEEKYFYTGNVLKDRMNYQMLRKTLSQSDLCIAVSAFVKKSYCDEFNCDADRIKVVYNGIRIPTQKTDGNARHCDKNSIRLLYIGRLAEVKGVHLLLQAVKNLTDKGERITLDILGDGPMREAYEKMAENLNISQYVYFAGNQLQKQPYYDKADIFVYPSVWQEAFGIAIVEAMAQGLICVASDRGGIPEILEYGKDGYLFEGGNADALTGELGRALLVCKDRYNREKMAENAGIKAAGFAIEKMVENLQEICKELMEGWKNKHE